MRFSILAIGLVGSIAFAGQGTPTAVCNVTERSGTQSVTASYTFDGSSQEVHVKPVLLKDAEIFLRGSPGAVSDSQAFVMLTQISDLTTGAKSSSQAWFIGSEQYSDQNHDVIPGSLMTYLTLNNQEKVEITCFNPKR